MNDVPVHTTDFVDRISNRICLLLHKRLRSSTCLAAAVLLVYGFGHIDFQDFARLTRDPFITLPGADRQFLHSSPLGFFIGWPVTNLLGPNASYLLVTLAGLILLALALRLFLNMVPAEQRETIVLVLLSSPLLIVILRWLGKDDTYVLAFFLIYAATRRNGSFAFLFSLLMILGHKEIGTIILLGDAILRPRWPLGAMIGVLAGHILVHAYQASLSEPLFSRVDLAMSFVGPATDGWISNPVAHLALGFGWFWILLGLRWREPDRLRVAMVVALCFVASFTTADFTRDFILCAVPLLLYTAERIAASPAQAAVLSRAPFPYVFVVQAQILGFHEVHDSLWLSAGADWLQKVGIWH